MAKIDEWMLQKMVDMAQQGGRMEAKHEAQEVERNYGPDKRDRKMHKDVMKAIRNMEPAWESKRGRKFALMQQREVIPNDGYRLRPSRAEEPAGAADRRVHAG